MKINFDYYTGGRCNQQSGFSEKDKERKTRVTSGLRVDIVSKESVSAYHHPNGFTI